MHCLRESVFARLLALIISLSITTTLPLRPAVTANRPNAVAFHFTLPTRIAGSRDVLAGRLKRRRGSRRHFHTVLLDGTRGNYRGGCFLSLLLHDVAYITWGVDGSWAFLRGPNPGTNLIPLGAPRTTVYRGFIAFQAFIGPEISGNYLNAS